MIATLTTISILISAAALGVVLARAAVSRRKSFTRAVLAANAGAFLAAFGLVNAAHGFSLV